MVVRLKFHWQNIRWQRGGAAVSLGSPTSTQLWLRLQLQSTVVIVPADCDICNDDGHHHCLCLPHLQTSFFRVLSINALQPKPELLQPSTKVFQHQPRLLQHQPGHCPMPTQRGAFKSSNRLSLPAKCSASTQRILHIFYSFADLSGGTVVEGLPQHHLVAFIQIY